ncbi:IucA/IucC family protein [Roseateles sp. BYS96W]|uniref:IucA/IucC family protein n=1 Tax=Pelomonas nitida TaxID=3299027 RepID=A0ABW7G1K2_9BURK
MTFESIPDPAALPPSEATEQRAAIALSERNALRRLVRCLFAEGVLDHRTLLFAPNGRAASLPLWEQRALVHFEQLWAAPANTFVNQGSISVLTPGQAPRPIDTAAQLIDLLRPGFDFTPTEAGVAALKADMANSVLNDAQARTHRQAWNDALGQAIRTGAATGLVDYLRRHGSTRRAAMLLDQWGSLEGHPFYPTWKAKPNLDATQVAALSPEFGARVAVRIAALRADVAHLERMPHVNSLHDYFATEFPALWERWKAGLRARGLDEAQWLPLPIHAWHLENFVQPQYAKEIEAGLLITDGPEVEAAPTMSFRTLLPQEPGTAPFIKLPVALWLTSEQRSLQAKSIHMGPRISHVIQRILSAEGGFENRLEIFAEEVAFHYRDAATHEDAPGRYLSVAFRQSTHAFERNDGLLPMPVAALLTQAPVTRRPLITELIERPGQRASADTVEAFFRRYARVVTRPVIAIYMLYGIGLEAHQQNTSVLFDGDGEPRSLLIRDFGDGRTYAPLLNERGLTLQPYVHKGILPTVFTTDIEPVRTFVIDACFVCHLHELALLLTDEYGLAPSRLWDILREETVAAFDAVAPRITSQAFWQAERDAFLVQPWPTRSVLRMHLQRYADYRLQHLLPNPMGTAST